MTTAQRRFLRPEEWKRDVAAHARVGDPYGKGEAPGCRKRGVFGVKQVGDELSRTLEFTISTAGIDRDRDTISADGWDLENYRNNPVVLFGHDYTDLPVARSLEEWVEGSGAGAKLKSTAEFIDRDTYPFADTVYQLYRREFMRAVSVGFLPTDWAFVEEDDRPFGVDFKSQELLEYSTVPVPSNPEALQEARSLGIDLTPMKGWAEKILDEWSPDTEAQILVPRKLFEDVNKVLTGRGRGIAVPSPEQRFLEGKDAPAEGEEDERVDEEDERVETQEGEHDTGGETNEGGDPAVAQGQGGDAEADAAGDDGDQEGGASDQGQASGDAAPGDQDDAGSGATDADPAGGGADDNGEGESPTVELQDADNDNPSGRSGNVSGVWSAGIGSVTLDQRETIIARNALFFCRGYDELRRRAAGVESNPEEKRSTHRLRFDLGVLAAKLWPDVEAEDFAKMFPDLVDADAEVPGTKAGRVLSKANEDRLTEARDLISGVLEQVADAAEVDDDGQPVEEAVDDPEAKTITLDDLLDVDPEVFTAAIGEVAGAAAEREVGRLRGRKT